MFLLRYTSYISLFIFLFFFSLPPLLRFSRSLKGLVEFFQPFPMLISILPFSIHQNPHIPLCSIFHDQVLGEAQRSSSTHTHLFSSLCQQRGKGVVLNLLGPMLDVMKLYCIFVVIWCVLYETRKFVSATLCLLQVEFVNYGFKNRFFDPKNLGKYIWCL